VVARRRGRLSGALDIPARKSCTNPFQCTDPLKRRGFTEANAIPLSSIDRLAAVHGLVGDVSCWYFCRNFRSRREFGLAGGPYRSCYSGSVRSADGRVP
jgi:hypothetical protein